MLIDNGFGGADVSNTSGLIMTIGLEKILENLAASLTKLTLDSSGESQSIRAGEVGVVDITSGTKRGRSCALGTDNGQHGAQRDALIEGLDPTAGVS